MNRFWQTCAARIVGVEIHNGLGGYGYEVCYRLSICACPTGNLKGNGIAARRKVRSAGILQCRGCTIAQGPQPGSRAAVLWSANCTTTGVHPEVLLAEKLAVNWAKAIVGMIKQRMVYKKAYNLVIDKI